MSKTIEHAGIIKEIKDGSAEVIIVQNSACSACHAKSACTAADRAEKMVTVETGGQEYKVGDHVIIEGTTRMGFLAVFYAFVLPFILMLGILIAIVSITGDELMASLSALLSLCLYYLILYLFKNKMKSKFIFHIKRA